jgi:hypothetical protein
MAKKKTAAAKVPAAPVAEAPAVAAVPASAPADAASPAPAAKTQAIKFLRTHPNYAYSSGDTADLTADHVELLTEGGFAELVTK